MNLILVLIIVVALFVGLMALLVVVGGQGLARRMQAPPEVSESAATQRAFADGAATVKELTSAPGRPVSPVFVLAESPGQFRGIEWPGSRAPMLVSRPSLQLRGRSGATVVLLPGWQDNPRYLPIMTTEAMVEIATRHSPQPAAPTGEQR